MRPGVLSSPRMEPYRYPERADGDELFAAIPPRRTASPAAGIFAAFAIIIAAMVLGGL